MSKKGNIPKSLTKAATRNMKVIKSYKPSRKERIDRLIESKKAASVSPPKNEEDKLKYFMQNEAQKQSDNYCTVEYFEKSVYSLEGIKVILRAPTYATVGRYTYRTKCSKDTTIREFIERRIKTSIDSTYQICIISDKDFSMDDPISVVTNYNHLNSLVD